MAEDRDLWTKMVQKKRWMEGAKHKPCKFASLTYCKKLCKCDHYTWSHSKIGSLGETCRLSTKYLNSVYWMVVPKESDYTKQHGDKEAYFLVIQRICWHSSKLKRLIDDARYKHSVVYLQNMTWQKQPEIITILEWLHIENDNERVSSMHAWVGE
jgi:hypothetical protein